MSTRGIVLSCVLATLVGTYGWFVLWPESEVTKVAVTQRAPRPLTFNFSRPLIFDDIRIITYEAGPPGAEAQGYDRTVWHLEINPERKDDRQARRTVTYGRGIRGMRAAEGMPRRAEPLKPGTQYTFVAQTNRGERIQTTFVPR